MRDARKSADAKAETSEQSPRLRLATCWSDDPELGSTFKCGLTNCASETLKIEYIALTGFLWIKEDGKLRNVTLLRKLSNYLELSLEEREISPGSTVEFRIGGLNLPANHASDGPKSAFVKFHDGSFEEVCLDSLKRLHTYSPEISGDSSFSRDLGSAAQVLPLVPMANTVMVAVSATSAQEATFCLTETTHRDFRHQCDSVVALAKRLFPNTKFDIHQGEHHGSKALEVKIANDETLPAQGYRLEFSADSVLLIARTGQGVTHGLVSLAQLAVALEAFPFPVRGLISDRPQHEWRGFMLDAVRAFFPLPQLLQFVDLMAWFKLNRFHLHLTDDEGWRFDMPGFSQFVEQCAWRGADLEIPPLLGSSFAPYGGIYSDEDISNLRARATEFGIQIIPEFDLPCHSYAATRAVDGLLDPQDSSDLYSVQGFIRNSLNPAQPKSFRFVEQVVERLVELFPGSDIHIGGDEVHGDTWSASPMVAKMVSGKESAKGLAGHLIKHAHDIVSHHGLKTVMWSDYATQKNVDPDKTTLIVWQQTDLAEDLAQKGFRMVLSPGSAYYLDMARDANWDTPGESWAGVVSLADAYRYQPFLNWSAVAARNAVGVQSCLWSSHLVSKIHVNELMFPRFQAIAETGWTEPSGRSLESFLQRLKPHLFDQITWQEV